MNSPNISIIILNWNGWKDTIECLESLYQIEYSNYDVIVVDNGSEDESVEKIKEYAKGKMEVKSKFIKSAPKNKPIKVIQYKSESQELKSEEFNEYLDLQSNRKLTLIKNDKNYGFAEGNNIAIKYALKYLNPNYVLLLNNDTVVDKYFLDKLVEVAEGKPEIGIVGPTVYYYRDFDKVQSAGAKIYWYKGKATNIKSPKKDQTEPKEVDSVIGCALLTKTEVLEKVGYLNKNYFAYLEETEFCVRASRASYKIIYVPESKIWHKGGATSNKINGFFLYHFTRNRFWFMKEHASKLQYLCFLIYFFGFQIWFTIGTCLIYYENKTMLISFLKGIKDGTRTPLQ